MARNPSLAVITAACGALQNFPKKYPVPLQTQSFSVAILRGEAAAMVSVWGDFYGPRADFLIEITQNTTGETFCICPDYFMDGAYGVFFRVLDGKKPGVKRKNPKAVLFWAENPHAYTTPILKQFLSETTYDSTVDALKTTFNTIGADFAAVLKKNNITP